MRIKIIGDNNCARATRHLLRLAGFAVTEFLPVEVVTQAPHLGFAITIETASAGLSAPGEASACPASMARTFSEGLTSVSRAASTAKTFTPWAPSGTHTRLAPAPQPLTPASQPDSSTHGQPATVHGEASPSLGGASSPASFSGGENLAGEDDSAGEGKSRQAEIEDPGPVGTCPAGNIHFDSVDGELEAAVLRHVTQLAAAPVMVDRPGGVVHSERELRIILPETGDARAGDAAAVAVEFGVLRGLLDLTRRSSHGELRAGADGQISDAPGKTGRTRGTSRSKWWIFGGALLAVSGAMLGAGLQATPRVNGAAEKKITRAAQGPQENITSSFRGAPRAGESLFLLTLKHGEIPHFVRNDSKNTHFANCEGTATCGQAIARAARMRVEAGMPVILETRVAGRAALRPAAAFAAAEPQGQFSSGQAVRIFDGTNTLVVDPCQAQTKLFASINQTGNTQLVAGTSAKKIYICSIHVVVAAATSVALVEGTGTVCGTGTAGVSGFGGATPATGWNFMANGGIALGSGVAAVGAEGTSADNLCLFNSGSGQVSGGISYVVE